MAFGKQLSLQLIAPVANGVSLSQAIGAGASANLNGSLVANGIAVFDAPRRVAVTSAGNDSANTFTITGINRQGNVITEALAGANAATAYTKADFASVTKVVSTNATAANVTIGTNGVASTAPWIVDFFSVSPQIGASVINAAANTTWQLETSNDDFSQIFWDCTNANWFQSMNAAQNPVAKMIGDLTAPLTMARLTVLSGTGLVTASLSQSVGSARI